MRNQQTGSNHITISLDETHHLRNGKPLYERRFTRIMSFHDPGIAAALDETGAYHIDRSGQPAYSRRFVKTFGFYDGIAAVEDERGYCHIDLKGNLIYDERYAWVGNFQEGMCVVRDHDNRYFHINKGGKRPYLQRYSYVGDFKYGIATAYDLYGQAIHIDTHGKLVHPHSYLELGVYHKGFATARDAGGYFHIDKSGQPIYSEKYAAVEPFYNGWAICRTHDETMILRSEDGKIINLHASQDIEQKKRQEMAKISKLIYEKQYNCAADGNISVRLPGDKILISPSFVHKGFVHPEDFVVVDITGKRIAGNYEPSSEYRLHLTIYEKRPDVKAVIHAHAPYCIALSLAGIDLRDGYVTMKPAPTAEFARPSSPEVPEKIEHLIPDHKSIILKRHGVVTYGKDLWDAFIRLETVEITAKIVLLASGAGKITPVEIEDKDRLYKWWNLKLPAIEDEITEVDKHD